MLGSPKIFLCSQGSEQLDVHAVLGMNTIVPRYPLSTFSQTMEPIKDLPTSAKSG